MKFLRLVFSMTIGLAAGLFLAITFLGYSSFESSIDRLFLILVPALAISLVLHQAFPPVSAWIKRIHSSASPSVPHYLISFFLSLSLTYGAVGFLNEALRTPFDMVVFAAACIVLGSAAGYPLSRRAAHSLRAGFLSRPVNRVLALALPLLLSAAIYGGAQFPSMFLWDYIVVPEKWMTMFIVTALAAGACGFAVLEKFETGGYYEKLKQTKLAGFASQNLPGLYAGGMFFLIHLILARALNHPALSYNSVLFEADAGPWMTILASPEGDEINRSVHPLSLIIIRPLVRLAAGFMGAQHDLGGMLVISAVAGLCVLMAWLFVERATDSKTYAFLFSILLGSTATHLLFGSLAENYIFGAASLIFFFLLIQAGEKRFSILVPAGLLLFGITITNLAQGMIGLFFGKFGFRRLLQYCGLVLALGVILTVFTSALYPTQTLFFVPADLAFELIFVKSSPAPPAAGLAEKFQVVSRTMFLYGMAAPQPLEVISEKPPFPTIDFKTFDSRTHKLASYKGLANIPLALWLILLAGAFLTFIKNIRTSKHPALTLGLLGTLGFNFLMHMVYGTELFLYTPYWIYALVCFVSLALSQYAGKTWLETGLTLVVLVLMANNFWFVFTIMRGLAPFYAAAP